MHCMVNGLQRLIVTMQNCRSGSQGQLRDSKRQLCFGLVETVLLSRSLMEPGVVKQHKASAMPRVGKRKAHALPTAGQVSVCNAGLQPHLNLHLKPRFSSRLCRFGSTHTLF